MVFERRAKPPMTASYSERMRYRRPATRYGRGVVVTDALDEDLDALRDEVARLRELLDERCPAPDS